MIVLNRYIYHSIQRVAVAIKVFVILKSSCEAKRRHSGERNVTKFDNVSSNIFIVQLPGGESPRAFAESREMDTVLPLLSSAGRALFFVGRKATSISSDPRRKKFPTRRAAVFGNGRRPEAVSSVPKRDFHNSLERIPELYCVIILDCYSLSESETKNLFYS